MPDRKLYYEDPARTKAETEVVEAGERDGRPWVRLAETVFYPEGGGQPADRGTISGVAVLDVRSRGDEVLHFVARPLPPGPVVAEIDAARRFDFRQQHSAQHLLTALLQDRHGLPTTSFHLGEEIVAIEVDGPVPNREALAGFEAEANAAIREDRPVTTRWIDPGDLDAAGVRTRGLPEGHSGPVRLVEIGGIDVNTCGGTHVTRLAEIQAIHVIDAEAARGGARIRFLAGGRVLARLRAAEDRDAELKARLAAPPEEFARILDARAAEQKALAKRLKTVEADLADRVGAGLAAEGGDRIARRLPEATPEFLRRVAGAATATRPDATVILVGGGEGEGEACFLVSAGADGPADVSAEGTCLRDALGARGGGRGRMFQGTGGTWREGAL